MSNRNGSNFLKKQLKFVSFGFVLLKKMGCSSSKNTAVVDNYGPANHETASSHSHLSIFSSSSSSAPMSTQVIADISYLPRHGTHRRYNDIYLDHEIHQLQTDLQILEHLFQILLGQTFTTELLISSDTPSSPPPASEQVIGNLFETRISQADLECDGNRECCVCFVEYEVGRHACRLPCGHIFHRSCVSEWLRKKCSCPVCRYEMRTDNQLYEKDRVERMKSRKLRLKYDDIACMSISQLQDVIDESSDDRDELIEMLSSRVEWIVESR